MALIADNVSFTYEAGTAFAVPAITGANVRIDRGRIVLIVGPSGAGKSTLLGLLGGMLAPTSGRVLVDGLGLSTPEAHGSVGVVFQNPEAQLFAETVSADVAFGPRNLGKGQAEAESLSAEAMRNVGLEPTAFGQRSPFTLSGGEARRAALAGVLAMRPAYLLLDEPTAGLDAEGRIALLGALDVARRDAGLAIVTHDPADLLPLADEVLAVSQGTVKGRSSVSDLYADPLAFARLGVRAPDVEQVQALASVRSGVVLPLASEPEEAADRLLRMREAAR